MSPELLLADDIPEHDVGQLHHELPKLGILLKQGYQRGVGFGVHIRILVIVDR